jgi:hypothetical protein
LSPRFAFLTLASLAFLLVAAPGAGAAGPAPPPLACAWNHNVVQDQFVIYDGGSNTAAVGVVFLDGPICQVRVVCGGDVAGINFACAIPPLP